MQRAQWGLIAAMWLACTASAEAAMAVSPSRIVYQAKPNATVRGTFTVKNTGEERLEVSVEPEDWAGGLTGARKPPPWVKVRPAHVTLKPGKHARVTYTIRIPPDARGELRSQVFFSSRGSDPASPLSRVGAIIYIGVQGTEQIDAAITSLDARYTVGTPGATQPDELALIAGIRNLGNAHIIPEGEFLVRDEAGRVSATIPLAPGWGLLPGQEEPYQAVGHGIHLTPGRYVLEAKLRCGDDLGAPTTLTKTAEIVFTESGEFQVNQTHVPPGTP